MCQTFKASISGFVIISVIALMLFYRANRWDRALAFFIFAVGLIQVIEAGIHSGANPQQSGQLLWLALWLQPIILSIGVFVYISQNTEISRYNTILRNTALVTLIIFAIVFGIAVITSFSPRMEFSGEVGESGHIRWLSGSEPLMSKYGWLYLIGLFFPLILLLANSKFSDIGIGALIVYGVLSLGWTLVKYPANEFSSQWCYLSFGFAALAFFVGGFYDNKCT